MIGRLLHDADGLYEDHLEALRADTARHGTTREGLDFALLVDGLRAEREQGITIDVAYRYFATPRRKFIIADTPGHESYTRNMATGASTCDLAVILVDARKGVVSQTKRHSFIASLLGIRHLVVAVNKMDLVGWSEEAFERIRTDYASFAARLETADVTFIPLCALLGDNVVARSGRTRWYQGPPLLDHLETVHVESDRNLIDFRFPVQRVCRPDPDFRGYAGTVASGVVRAGDEVLVLPSRRRTRVARIVTFDGDLAQAFPPQAVTLTLTDDLDVGRGDLLVHPGNLPDESHELEAILVWLADEPWDPGRLYEVRLAGATAAATISQVRCRVDVNTLRREPADGLSANDIARVRISATRALPHDPYSRNKATGALVLADRTTHAPVAAAMVVQTHSERPAAEVTGARHASAVQPGERERLLGQKAVTVWLTGLPKSGKSSIAFALERRLLDMGRAANVLDGSILRRTVSRGLGFGGDDRRENVFRAASVARICNDAGLVTVAAFVSPTADDRALARDLVGADRFLEVHCAAPLAACEARDGEGVYARARRGELPGFSGVGAPYEPPEAPDLSLPTHEIGVEESVERIVELLIRCGFVPGLPSRG